MANEKALRAILAPQFPLRVLMIEDNPVDAELCIEFLSAAQFEVTADVVQTPKELVKCAKSAEYDIILADYNLGAWTGMDAFDLLKEEGCEVPFILLTAALGDSTAVECMRRGLADYVLKDRLERLPVAIYRALEQKAAANERRRSARHADETEEKFRALADISSEAVFIEQGGRCTYMNRAAETITGYRRKDLTQVTFWQLVPKDQRMAVYGHLHGPNRKEEPAHCETEIITKSGTRRPVSCTMRELNMQEDQAMLISLTPLAKETEVAAPAWIELSDDSACLATPRKLALAF